MEATTSKRLKVAITHGDINGISYEVILKTFADERILELFTPIIYGSGKAAAYWRHALNIESVHWQPIHSAEEAREGTVNLIDIADGDVRVDPGKVSTKAGELALRALERATEDALAGRVDLMVTAPINKGAMPRDQFPYAGHTQYLEDKAALEQGKSLMLLCAGDCRIALVTGHIPISAVSGSITSERIIQKAQTMEAGLIKDFGIIKPRLAVLALNPHAGDQGLIGDEEETIIRPAIEALNQAGHIVFGPYAPDGFWAGSHVGHFDGILAMYHDQGLTPFKALYMTEGVNITLGLKFVRTSPDHGTGYDIVGKGIATADSFREAIYLGIDVVRNRRRHAEATRNPLRRVYFNKGRDDEKLDFNTPDQY